MPNNGETEDVRTSAINRRNVLLGGTTLAAASAIVANNPIQGAQAQAQPAATDGKPNILLIWGDDIGIANISAYSNGLMGYETPNIDRIGREGIMFLHYYGEQSCTAGRAAFLTGQHGIRTGLTKVGFPGAPMGMSQLDPSVGGLLKNLGYATGQFGKNHVGDRNESLPTVNGFDEFVGNLYHLNAEEEPELPDYPKDPAYLAKYGPRGVLKCKATDRDDPTVDPRFDKIGKQTIEDTGPLTKKRMETIDDKTSTAAIDYMKRQHTAGKPFFVWFNSTRMHLRTHVRAEHRGRYKHGDSEYIDGMMEHDDTVGTLLKALDDMGIANNTIVVYSSDNGPHMNTWPDAAMTWFRSEKDTNWEGAFRVPCLVRWPGKIKPGTVTNEIMSHNDDTHALRGRRRAGHRQQAEGGLHGQRHQLQSPARRLQPVGVSARRERLCGEQQRHEKRPQYLLLRRRRRPARGLAARRLQIQLFRTAHAGNNANMGRTLHHASAPKDLQPHAGPVRTSGHHVQHLLGLADQPRRCSLWHDGRGV
jgi:arylsulfatase